MKTSRDLLGYAAMAGGALALGGRLNAAEPAFPGRPNILWLTTEDSSEYEFTPYGNRDVKLPNLDALAARGVTFTHACSTGTQCSPARSSFITGAYATTYGMDYHRGKVPVPEGIFFPELLRQAGYYCTNARKTDYNAVTAADGDCWDVCDGQDGMEPDVPQNVGRATYENPDRRPDQPFFAVFNYFGTHMRYVRTAELKARVHEPGKGADPATVALPPHVPDLPEVRSDYATHLDRIAGMDVWLGNHLRNLERLGLQDDTIVFFFADNGGCLPRGKGYAYQTGHRVPMVVHVPPKWRHLFPAEPGTHSERLVSFVDLAPTVLSLAGLEIPERMPGAAFMGPRTAEAPALQFGFTTNSGDHFVPTRSVSDGRFKILHAYVPHKPDCLRNFFQWGMPANLAWDSHVLEGGCEKPEWLAAFRRQRGERLFDLQSDPFQLNDISGDPQHAATLARLRQGLSEHLRATGDLGFFPFTMRDKGGKPLHDWVRETGFPLDALITAAETASAGDPANRGKLVDFLKSERPELRYWGASGLATLAAEGQGGECPAELLSAMTDQEPSVAAEAAHAVCYYGRVEEGIAVLMQRFEQGVADFQTLQETGATIRVKGFADGSLTAYSALETLSLDERFKPELIKMAPRLEVLQEGYRRDDRRGAKQSARSILVNLGVVPVSALYHP